MAAWWKAWKTKSRFHIPAATMMILTLRLKLKSYPAAPGLLYTPGVLIGSGSEYDYYFRGFGEMRGFLAPLGMTPRSLGEDTGKAGRGGCRPGGVGREFSRMLGDTGPRTPRGVRLQWR